MTVRAVAAVLLLTIAYHGAYKPMRDFRAGISEVEKARRIATRGLLENNKARLVLSTQRTYGNFALYLGFDRALYARTHLCDTAPIREDGQDAIVFIDKKLSAFLARAYQWPNCNDELIGLAKARGIEAVIDNKRLYLSFQRRGE